jgi:nucleoporin POM152
VRIQEGLDHLREGDDPAAFKVTFTGTAPFSFTYIRSEMVSGKNRVVETQVS